MALADGSQVIVRHLLAVFLTLMGNTLVCSGVVSNICWSIGFGIGCWQNMVSVQKGWVNGQICVEYQDIFPDRASQ